MIVISIFIKFPNANRIYVQPNSPIWIYIYERFPKQMNDLCRQCQRTGYWQDEERQIACIMPSYM